MHGKLQGRSGQSQGFNDKFKEKINELLNLNSDASLDEAGKSALIQQFEAACGEAGGDIVDTVFRSNPDLKGKTVSWFEQVRHHNFNFQAK